MANTKRKPALRPLPFLGCGKPSVVNKTEKTTLPINQFASGYERGGESDAVKRSRLRRLPPVRRGHRVASRAAQAGPGAAIRRAARTKTRGAHALCMLQADPPFSGPR